MDRQTPHPQNDPISQGRPEVGGLPRAPALGLFPRDPTRRVGTRWAVPAGRAAGAAPGRLLGPPAPGFPLLPLPQAAVKFHVALGTDLAIHSVRLPGHKAGAVGSSHGSLLESPVPVPVPQRPSKKGHGPRRSHRRCHPPQGSQPLLCSSAECFGVTQECLHPADSTPAVLGTNGQSSPIQGSQRSPED